MTANLVAAIFAPIQDCDEVFNYWEPTHYLNHGYGLQTWEYSPEYAIRSWAYAGVHALIAASARLVPVLGTKIFQFYFLRVSLGLTCAFCEARLYSKISQLLNPRIAYFFALVMATSTGMFHASVAYLPSSFAMYTTMLGIADFMEWRGGLRTYHGIFWIGFGTFITLQTDSLDHRLVIGLLERWFRENRTLHLVGFKLGLSSIDWVMITGISFGGHPIVL